MQCADQFNTDAYSIWGTPWSVPYLSRPDNAAVPAKDYESSSKAVVMQWAPRDPNRAYGPSVINSTFSMQDYASKSYDLRYIQYLQDIFLKQAGDQVVFGLEGGVIPQGYRDYGKQVAQTKLWEKEGRLQIQTMKEYANDFMERKRVFPPDAYFLSKDYENTDQSFWYNSPHYRLGIQKNGDTVTLVDFRNYDTTPEEDFNFVPNTQKLLRINTTSIIDSVRFPNQKKVLATQAGPLTFTEDKFNKLTIGTTDIVTLNDSYININGKIYEFKYPPSNTNSTSLQQQALIAQKVERMYNVINSRKLLIMRSKKQALIAFVEMYMLLGLMVSTLVLFKTGNKKAASFIPVFLLVCIGWQVNKIINVPENSFLTNYEAEALHYVQGMNRKIIYLDPEENLEFRAAKPLFYGSPQIAEKLTKQEWKYLKRTKAGKLEDLEVNTILIVPRYLGQEVSISEINSLGLDKVFDNAQIEIYKHN